MSFQAYLDTIQAKTGQSPDDFRAYAVWQGYMDGDTLRPDIKAGKVIADLKRDFGLGHGHAMAIFALLKGLRKDGVT